MTIEAHVGAPIRTKRAPRLVEEAIAERAAAQHGVVSRSQLLDLGLTASAVKRRVSFGRLQPLHRGVYAVGHRVLRREGFWMAAVLAGGPGAALSHRSAAAFWAIRGDTRPRIEVSVPRHRRSTARLEVHVVAMRPDEVEIHDGIRVTTPARTLFDLAAVVSRAQLEAAFNEAEYRRLTSPVSLDALVARYPRRRGTADLRRVLDNHHRNGETRTRSELERELIALVDAAGLPRPLINRETEHGEIDARWPEHRLIVECDGFAAHGTRKAFEDDRARDRALTADGWRVVRITARQLTEDAETIARQLARLLGQAAAARSPSAAAAAARPVRTAPSATHWSEPQT